MTAPADPADLPASARRVADALAADGHPAEIRLFAESTRSAAEAAAAIGTTVAQIAKSLIFRAGDRPVLAIASGVNRIDETKLASALADRLGGAPIGRADAAFVRQATGFAIGGVPPVGQRDPAAGGDRPGLAGIRRGLAAAGTPNAVFRTTGEASPA